MNWRAWVYTRLTTDSAIQELVPVASVFGGGALRGVPHRKPFIVIRLDNLLPAMKGDDGTVAVNQLGSVSVHDQPGDYQRIDTILQRIKDRIDLVTPVGGVAAQWQGVGPDSADDQMGTLTKTAEFRLIGRA